LNPKAIYIAAGGIAAAAIALFFLMGSGNFGLPIGQQGNQTLQQVLSEPQLSVRNITVTSTGNESASVLVELVMHNPNSHQLQLEILDYDLNVAELRMTGGIIGGIPEGMVASSADLTPLPAENSVVLRNTQVVTRSNLNADSWDRMVAGTAEYEVTGFYQYRSTVRLETTAGENEFTLMFP
jgi:hypothetical protein